MLREKPANEQAVQRLTDYLKMVSFCLKGSGADADFKTLQSDYQVSKSTYSDLKQLGIIEKGEHRHIWKAGSANERTLALKVLDHRLKKYKKKLHVPIPDLAAIGDTLKTIAERMMQITAQQESWLKRAKNGQSDEMVDINQSNIFEQQQQRQKDRVYIAGQIASKVYISLPIHSVDFEMIEDINNSIVLSTDDLLKRLYNEGN